ncbi:hypothetical protein IAU60_004744 [Kwoniella sp. DSM 27419]
MSLLPRSLRAVSRGSRSFATTAQISAAPAATPRYVRKTPVPARSPSSYSKASTSASRPAYKPASAPTAAQAQPQPAQELADLPEDLPSEFLDEYALSSTSPSATAPSASASANTSANTAGTGAGAAASPPLTSLPGEGYQSLPSANGGTSGSSGIAGEAPVGQDWSTSFSGLSERPFDKEAAEALLRPLSAADVEIKPDGLLYLPEIKYRRTLNAAFGPGGWGLAPRGETHVGPRIVSREWGLVCLGRLVSVARGEQEYFDPSGIPTATEACKSNALMRCCKDLGIASELWDPSFIRDFKKQHCVEVFVEHATKKSKKKLWRKKDSPKFDYPWKE